MNVLWNKKIEIENLWLPSNFGIFFKQDERVAYFFRRSFWQTEGLFSILDNETEPKMLYSSVQDEMLPLPSNWEIVETLQDPFLLVSEDCGLNLKSNVFSHKIPEQLQIAYRQQHLPSKYYVEEPKHLGEFTIHHKGNWGYICMKEHAKVWEFTGRAYLYTEMMRWKDRLFFGTGGYGGYFYVLDINNGLPLASIKTGGTRSFAHVDNVCYVLKNEKKAKLLCIDLSNGKTMAECELPGVAALDSRIAMIDNHIHVITFNFLRSEPVGFTWSCVKI